MFLWRPTDTILGVSIQAAQSRVGKVLYSWAMWPPMLRLPLHQIDLLSGLRQPQCRLHACDACTEH